MPSAMASSHLPIFSERVKNILLRQYHRRDFDGKVGGGGGNKPGGREGKPRLFPSSQGACPRTHGTAVSGKHRLAVKKLIANEKEGPRVRHHR